MDNNLGLGARSLLDLIAVILQMFRVAISHSIDVEDIGISIIII